MKKLLGILVLGLLLSGNSLLAKDLEDVFKKGISKKEMCKLTRDKSALYGTILKGVAYCHKAFQSKFIYLPKYKTEIIPRPSFMWVDGKKVDHPEVYFVFENVTEPMKCKFNTFCKHGSGKLKAIAYSAEEASVFADPEYAKKLEEEKKKKEDEQIIAEKSKSKKKVTLEIMGRPYPQDGVLFRTQKTKLVKKDTWDLYSFFHSTIQEVKNKCTAWKKEYEMRKDLKCLITVIRYSDSTNPNKVQKIVNGSGIVTHKVKIGWNGIEGAIADATPIKPKKKKPKQTPDDDKILAASSGSGFFVTRAGHLVTNYHVVEECDAVKVSFNAKEIQADTIAIDKFNDLAIIKGKINPSKVFPVSREDVSLLQDIIVAGFPLGKRISALIKTHKGSVTGLAGIGDNYSNFQTDATINHGNSGGPILTQKGNVIGVAVQLIPPDKAQNIFFGVKSSTLTTFAKANNVNFLPPNTREMSNKDLGELITEATVFLECWMTVAKIKQMIAQEENRKAFYSEHQ